MIVIFGTRRRALVLLALCMILMTHTSIAQETRTSNRDARKFDEFGDIQYSDLIARLDNFAVQLQQEPDTRGFVIAYRTRRDLPGLSSRYAMRMKNYLVSPRGIPSERVATVDGGVAACLTQELWIVPIGAIPQTRRDAYSNSFFDPDSPRKFDEHYFSPEESTSEVGSFHDLESMASHLDAFGIALQKEPRARAYLIGYAQYYVERGSIEYVGKGSKNYRRVHMDPASQPMKILKQERDYLVKTYGIAPSRIKLVNGGYRSFRAVELWIVPRGVDAPVATPTRLLSRRSRR